MPWRGKIAQTVIQYPDLARARQVVPSRLKLSRFMNRTLAAFERHIQEPSPAFLCSSCGDPDAAPTFMAAVQHRVEEPASKTDLELLRQTLGPGSRQVREFYARHNGITLYCDKRSDDAGIRFFPIGDWPSITTEVPNDFRATGLDVMYGSLIEPWRGSMAQSVIKQRDLTVSYYQIGAEGAAGLAPNGVGDLC